MLTHPLLVCPAAFVAGVAIGVLLGLGLASILVGLGLETIAIAVLVAPALKREQTR